MYEPVTNFLTNHFAKKKRNKNPNGLDCSILRTEQIFQLIYSKIILELQLKIFTEI